MKYNESDQEHFSNITDFGETCCGYVGAYLNHNELVWFSNVYCIPVIATIGVLSNGLNIVVLCRNSERLPSSFYLCALAVCDCLFLIFGTLEVTPITLDILSVNALFNKWYTATVLYIRVIAATAFKSSVGLVIAFNVERYVSVRHPLYSHAFCNKTIAHRLCAGIILSCFVLSIHWPVTYSRESYLNLYTNSTYYYIQLKPVVPLQYFERVMNYLSMACFNVVPILLLCILNCLLIKTLRDVIRSEPRTYDPNGRRRSGQLSAHTILFAVVFMFLFCNGPQVPARILYEIYGPNNQLVMSYVAITQQLIFLNASMNFALYCLVSRRYRYLLKKTLICCDCAKKLRRSLENVPLPPLPSPRRMKYRHYNGLKPQYSGEVEAGSWRKHYV